MESQSKKLVRKLKISRRNNDGFRHILRCTQNSVVRFDKVNFEKQACAGLINRKMMNTTDSVTAANCGTAHRATTATRPSLSGRFFETRWSDEAQGSLKEHMILRTSM